MNSDRKTQPVGQFLASLAELGVLLWVEDGRLRVNAPQGALTPDLREVLSSRKEELLHTLASQSVQHEGLVVVPLADRAGALPLAAGQERLWSLARMRPGDSVYNVPTVIRLAGRLDIAALEGALSDIATRHEIFRTSFAAGDLPGQLIMPARPFVLPVSRLERDLAALPPETVRAQLVSTIEQEVRKPFHLDGRALWRARLFVVGPELAILALTMHHAIFDGLSKGILLRELGQTYSALCKGEAPPCPVPSIQFVDAVTWLRASAGAERMARQEDYWKGIFGLGAPTLITPNSHAREAGHTPADSITFHLDPDLSRSVFALAAAESMAPFVVLLAGFALLLNRYSGQEDLLITTPMAGRTHASFEEVIGFFNNIVPLRADMSGNPSFRELLQRLRRHVLDVSDNQDVSLQKVFDLPSMVRTQPNRAMLSYQDMSGQALTMEGLEVGLINVRKDSADFELALYLERTDVRLEGVLDFNSALYERSVIEGMVSQFGAILSMAAADAGRLLGDFPFFGISEEEIEQRLETHPGIEAAAVIREPVSGAIHAYLVLDEHSVPSLDEVRAHAVTALPNYCLPASFTPIDQMPIGIDGQLDMAALPPLVRARQGLTRDYVAPRSPLERQLADLWKRVLWLDDEVGVEDDFRELGGHSLLSVQLVVELEKMLGHPVPVHLIGRLNTVAELAHAIENPDEGEGSGSGYGGLAPEVYAGLRTHLSSWEGHRLTPNSLIVGLNCEGTRKPLFWCLQRYQELAQLAHYLGDDLPVYGMRSGNRVMVKSQQNIELLASCYVDEILQIEPGGPYRIGGNCQAALIAFQVARMLRERGRDVSMLIMHERFARVFYDGPVALTFGRESPYNPKYQFHAPQAGWRKFFPGALAVREVSGGHGEFFREPHITDLTGAIQSFLTESESGTLASFKRDASGISFQRLDETAYRASIKACVPLRIAPGQCAVIPVEVENVSPVEWQPARSSGICLQNRWIDKSGKVLRQFDGSVPLPVSVAPGDRIQLELPVEAPSVSGDCLLEIDLVDEGVARFSSMGGKPCIFSVSFP